MNLDITLCHIEYLFVASHIASARTVSLSLYLSYPGSLSTADECNDSLISRSTTTYIVTSLDAKGG
jgi:hypothetical protein